MTLVAIPLLLAGSRCVLLCGLETPQLSKQAKAILVQAQAIPPTRGLGTRSRCLTFSGRPTHSHGPGLPDRHPRQLCPGRIVRVPFGSWPPDSIRTPSILLVAAYGGFMHFFFLLLFFSGAFVAPRPRGLHPLPPSQGPGARRPPHRAGEGRRLRLAQRLPGGHAAGRDGARRRALGGRRDGVCCASCVRCGVARDTGGKEGDRECATVAEMIAFLPGR